MAYVTGDAADMDAVKTALVDACTANGWTEDTDSDGKTVLVQDDSSLSDSIYVRVEKATDNDDNSVLELLGRTSLDGGDAPYVVSIRHKLANSTISYPVTYHTFVFLYEVYFIIQYGDRYQWCAFGQSQQSGLSGTGNWIGATFGQESDDSLISIKSHTGGYSFGSNTSAAWFWATSRKADRAAANCWVHNDIESSYPWALGNGSNGADPVGIRYLTELIKAQPNQFSGEGILLPIRAYKQRPESKVSQIAELENARHIRIDNYTPGEVITLGDDEWMVFPWFKKNTSERDGGSEINHTGTFGWAIKKE